MNTEENALFRQRFIEFIAAGDALLEAWNDPAVDSSGEPVIDNDLLLEWLPMSFDEWLFVVKASLRQ